MPLYRGWSIVLACGIIASFSWGLGFYGLGVYLHALNRLHGWSPGLISLAVTIYYALSAVFIVMVGGLIERRGPRGVLTYGVITMAAAVAALGLITAPWQLFAVYAVMATSWACLTPPVSAARSCRRCGAGRDGRLAFARRVPRRQSRVRPGGVGNLITLPPLLAREEFGQRSFGTVFGLVGAATQAGVAVGPGLMGLLRNALGSYQPALWCLVTLEGVAVASVLWGRRSCAAVIACPR